MNELHRTGNKACSDIRRIIKEPKSFRAESATLTTGRSKRVQFNTLPDLSGLKNRKSMFLLAEFDDNSPRQSNLRSNYMQQMTTDFQINNQNDSENGKPESIFLSENFVFPTSTMGEEGRMPAQGVGVVFGFIVVLPTSAQFFNRNELISS